MQALRDADQEGLTITLFMSLWALLPMWYPPISRLMGQIDIVGAAVNYADTNTTYWSPGVGSDQVYVLEDVTGSFTNFLDGDGGGETSAYVFYLAGSNNVISLSNVNAGTLGSGSYFIYDPNGGTVNGSASVGGGTLFSNPFVGSLNISGTEFINGGSTALDRCSGGTQSGYYVAAGSTAATACTTGGGSLVSAGVTTP